MHIGAHPVVCIFKYLKIVYFILWLIVMYIILIIKLSFSHHLCHNSNFVI